MTEHYWYVCKDWEGNVIAIFADEDDCKEYVKFCDGDFFLSQKEVCDLLNKLSNENEQLKKENKELKLQNGELLYQIGEVGKNNKTCRACECFITDINYCWMWDMEVEADDVVVACDQRKVKKYK